MLDDLHATCLAEAQAVIGGRYRHRTGSTAERMSSEAIQRSRRCDDRCGRASAIGLRAHVEPCCVIEPAGVAGRVRLPARVADDLVKTTPEQKTTAIRGRPPRRASTGSPAP